MSLIKTMRLQCFSRERLVTCRSALAILIVCSLSEGKIIEAASAEQLIGAGRNPDIAVDSAGGVHLVYQQGSNVVYLKPGATPTTIGTGRATMETDPHVALDASDTAHFAWSAPGNVIKYRKDGGTTYSIPRLCRVNDPADPSDDTYPYNSPTGVCTNIRKPRIAISGLAGFVFFEDRWPFAVRLDAALGSINPGSRIQVANTLSKTYDAGAVAVDGLGNGFFTARRSQALYFCKVVPGGSGCFSWQQMPGGGASDFSDATFNGGVVHISGLMGAQGDSIRYLTANTLQAPPALSNTNLPTDAEVGEHDNSGSGIGVAGSDIFIAWSSGNPDGRAWWFNVATSSGPNPLTSVASKQGEKFTYPEMDKSWVTWEDKRSGAFQIFVRDLAAP